MEKGVLFTYISLTSTTTFLWGISFPHQYAGLHHQHGNEYSRSGSPGSNDKTELSKREWEDMIELVDEVLEIFKRIGIVTKLQKAKGHSFIKIS